MSKKKIEEIDGIVLTVADNYSEWKHTVLKWIARFLFIERVNYVILVSEIKDRKIKDDRASSN